ncbi:MAG: FHA domain-containing protein [Ardenticatenaceae bacterium]
MADTILIGRSGGPLAWVVAIDGPDEANFYQLGSHSYLGRDQFCQIRLSDPRVSTRHACIRFQQGHFVLYDLASRNRTYLNGQTLIKPHPLMDGDVIGVGQSELVFKQAR